MESLGLILRRLCAARTSCPRIAPSKTGVNALVSRASTSCGDRIALASSAMLFILGALPAAAAEGCTQPSAPIATDRPDVTNSSLVVPVGSLQNENGANVSRRDGGTVFDGPNSRWRLGLAPCFEVLIDLPNYTGTFRGP